MEDYEAAVVGFAGGFELGDDVTLKGCGGYRLSGEPVLEIVVFSVF